MNDDGKTFEYTFNVEEYIGLRNEIVARLQLVNSQENTALLMIIGFWASGFISKQFDIFQNILSSNIVIILFLFVPMILLIPIAIKNGENIRQITAIYIYIKIFYEYPSYKLKGNKKFYWETLGGFASLTKLMKKSFLRRGELFLYNMSYFLLSIIETIILLVYVHFCYPDFLLICLCITAGITIFIFLTTNMQRNTIETGEELAEFFLTKSADMEVIKTEEVYAIKQWLKTTLC